MADKTADLGESLNTGAGESMVSPVKVSKSEPPRRKAQEQPLHG